MLERNFIILNMDILHSTYGQFPSIGGLFLQPWWWQALCPERDMRLLRVEDEGKLAGFWPLARRKRFKGLCRVYAAPVLTQHTGPWFCERKYLKDLLRQIPSKAMLCVNIGFELNGEEEALCHSLGISCRRKATQRIVDTSDLEAVWARVSTSRRRRIKNGMKHLHRVEAPTIEMHMELQKETYARQNMAVPFPFESLKRLYLAVKEQGAGELVALADAENRIMACGLFVYDKEACYIIASGYRKTEKDLGAGSLLMWKGIEIASSRGIAFDFEGSDIDAIANFNLSFGATQFTYTCLERYSRGFRMVQRILKR